MVMFHHEIPYRVGRPSAAPSNRGCSRSSVEGVPTLGEVDYARAEREIEAQLAPIPDLSSVRKV